MAKHKRASKPYTPQPTGQTPTPEQMKRSEYDVRQVHQNGPKVAVNSGSTPLDTLLRSGTITMQQHAGGKAYEIAHEMFWGRTGHRDTLDMSVRGGSDFEAGVTAKLMAKDLLADVDRALGLEKQNVLFDVAIMHRALGRNRGKSHRDYLALFAALDVCVDVFRIR